MKKSILISITLISILFSCQPKAENSKYLFFLHNRFLETHQLDELHPEYGRTEYPEILEKFKAAGFEVISEQRNGNVNAREYAGTVTRQIDSLIAIGVQPEAITVVGTSKGGYIAQYVSTLANNPDLNFVFVASFRESDIEEIQEINFCGNILTISEKSDPFGVSALSRFENSTCTIANFAEIELETGLNHGFIFKALDDWIQPTIKWADGNFDSFKNAKGVKYKTENLKVTQLTDDVFVHESYLKQYNNVACNGMIYVNKGEAIIFDTPTEDTAATELINWVEEELDAKIKAVVINHFHIDCLGGLAEFHKNTIPSYASELTIELASSEKSHNGVVPENGFQDSLILSIGNSSVENRFFGAGHAHDNIVSFVNDKNIMFGGCMIKSLRARKGNLTDADVSEWSNTVRKIKIHYGDELELVVPGHGVAGGVELLDYTIKLFEH